MLDSLGLLLNTVGSICQSFSSPIAFLKAYHGESGGCLVLDIRMLDIIISDFNLGGGETGIGAIARLRADAGWTIPAVLVTGDTSSLITEHMEAKPCRVLSKPIKTNVLIDLVHELTKARRL